VALLLTLAICVAAACAETPKAKVPTREELLEEQAHMEEQARLAKERRERKTAEEAAAMADRARADKAREEAPCRSTWAKASQDYAEAVRTRSEKIVRERARHEESKAKLVAWVGRSLKLSTTCTLTAPARAVCSNRVGVDVPCDSAAAYERKVESAEYRGIARVQNMGRTPMACLVSEGGDPRSLASTSFVVVRPGTQHSDSERFYGTCEWDKYYVFCSLSEANRTEIGITDPSFPSSTKVSAHFTSADVFFWDDTYTEPPEVPRLLGSDEQRYVAACMTIAEGDAFEAAGLAWQREPAAEPMSHQRAMDYCEGLALAGGGWRLPWRSELLALYQTKSSGTASFPGMDDRYWARDLGHGEAACVNFGNGDAEYIPSNTGNPDYRWLGAGPRVRCVR
jgi:hypothetical protein